MKKLEHFIYDILSDKAKKKRVILLTAVAFALSLLMFPSKLVLAKMLPGKSDNTFSIYIDTPTGSSIDQTKAVSECVIDSLQKEKEVMNIELFLGQGIPLDYAGLVKGASMKNSENVAEISVNLTDKHHRDEPSFLMVQRLRPKIQQACESLTKGTSIKFIEQPSGPPTMASIVVEVHGDNAQTTRRIAGEVFDILRQTEGLVDIDIMADEEYDKYELIPDKEKIARSGLSVEQVNNILYLAFEGMVIAHKNANNAPDQIPIFLVLDKESKQIAKPSIETLQSKLSSLNLMNTAGMMVSLGEVVTIKKVKSNPMIMHKNLSRMVNVIAETDMVSQVYPLLDARALMLEKFEKEYSITKADFSTYMFDFTLEDKKTHEQFLIRWDGEMKVTLDTFRDLGAAFISALLLIFLLLVIYYKSFVISGIVLLGSFLSLIGVIVGHWVANWFTSETFFLTATSLIGFIALIGISSRNSLLLIDFAKSLMQSEGIQKRRAIAIATATRAKPIALTAVAIILGSALLAGDPVFGGLGVALISGTVAAVFVSLLFVPVLMDNAKAMDFEKKEEIVEDHTISITR
ncbi:MAG TPA: efflux RND transporter permease subunit [Sulfurovum sp.]|nr:MAG: multidrug transporter AcrB [Sulfurovum sp. 35-42-20]OYZ25440.1 MAG: multidrug transporter AcrB [Sulfurovum sp. 16-42-52]OYZ48094.1 MAG: multidrug transporter AcrB [Sulfurovum sp. 24-42-9]OZA45409.1 MAG: multidrug transporter AcrB [Sulfurovum sp. 17-42-90]OZA61426.1 MAG: multidrug transporter AcrB [Sulfurovum sp. 39-42-12]HQR74709.1 efflux RND transporter permease subunit [Sulfurovum sp.]